MKVKRVIKEWEVWNKEEEAEKLKEEAKRLVLPKFHKWIHILKKKASKRMPIRKI